MHTDDRPIGYWLKRLDGLLETGFEHALTQHGVGRRHWQMLNAIASGAHDRSTIAAALEPFWTDDAISLEDVLDVLTRSGWVEVTDDGDISLTGEGQRTHGAILADVSKVRGAVLAGFAPGEYQLVVEGLRRMCSNVENVVLNTGAKGQP
jgi:hypothetical protein